MGRFSGIFTPKLGTTKLLFQTSNSFIAEKCEQEWEEKNVVLGMSHHGVVQCSMFRLVFCFGLYGVVQTVCILVGEQHWAFYCDLCGIQDTN